MSTFTNWFGSLTSSGWVGPGGQRHTVYLTTDEISRVASVLHPNKSDARRKRIKKLRGKS